nr:Smr/MutS family protein [Acetobacter conturbans]
MRRKRSVSDDEHKLWTAFVRDVMPLAQQHGRPPIVPATQSAPKMAPARSSAEGSAGGPPQPEPASPFPSFPTFTTHMRSMSFMTQGEIAVAAHLRGKAAKKKGTPHQTIIGAPQNGLDTGSWKRLSKGQMPVERKLDLHGMTAQAAFLRLHEFLYMAYGEGVRCVEIVTGLGSGAEGGILRRELPFWLGRADLRRMVLAATHSHDANRGAVRLLLRKRHRGSR